MEERTDFPEFDEKEIEYINSDGSKEKGKVIACNYDVGISIVSADDKDEYLLCGNGPSSSYWKGEDLSDIDFDHYKALFYNAVSQIEKGYYDERNEEKIDIKFPGNSSISVPDSSTCAFNQ